VGNVRVLVVDDSAFMRKLISDIINSDKQMTVVGTARNGKEALEKLQELKPDVITLDVEMPVMDGLNALDQIIKIRPTPVVMLSSLTQSGAEATLRALQRGAIDFIAKPSGSISLDIHKIQDEIKLKIKTASVARVPWSSRGLTTAEKVLASNKTVDFKDRFIQPVISPKAAGVKRPNLNNGVAKIDVGKTAGPEKYQTNAVLSKPVSKGVASRLVLIGTSTGGPKALYEVIPTLPENLSAGILVVQHMPPGFTRSLAERLDAVSPLHVKEAEDGEEIVDGTVYIAPGDYHFKVRTSGQGGILERRRLYVNLTKDPQVSGHRPSVDVMMTSVAQNFWAPMVAVILTGMGQDGTQGLKQLKTKQCRILVEDESTCVVFGMPKAAIAAGIVDRIVPLTRISTEIQMMLR
jgi:two-component system chemotaxis response regulator CheB